MKKLLLCLLLVGCGKDKNYYTEYIIEPDVSRPAPICDVAIYNNGAITTCDDGTGFVTIGANDFILKTIVHPCSKKHEPTLYKLEYGVARVKNGSIFLLSPGWYTEVCKFNIDSNYFITGYKP